MLASATNSRGPCQRILLMSKPLKKLLSTMRPPSIHQILADTKSYSRSQTVFSDSLFKASKASKCTLLKRLRDSECLNFWGGIAKTKSEGSPSKAYACASAGCLVEERRSLTTQWLFPKLQRHLLGCSAGNGSPGNRLVVRQMHKLDQLGQINLILDKNV